MTNEQAKRLANRLEELAQAIDEHRQALVAVELLKLSYGPGSLERGDSGLRTDYFDMLEQLEQLEERRLEQRQIFGNRAPEEVKTDLDDDSHEE